MIVWKFGKKVNMAENDPYMNDRENLLYELCFQALF